MRSAKWIWSIGGIFLLGGTVLAQTLIKDQRQIRQTEKAKEKEQQQKQRPYERTRLHTSSVISLKTHRHLISKPLETKQYREIKKR